MRTLDEIVEGAKDGTKPTHDECYYAMLALATLLNMASADIDELAYPENGRPQTWRAEEKHRRHKVAWATPPDRWLGDNVPGNPGYDAFRAMGKRLIDKVLSEHEAEANNG